MHVTGEATVGGETLALGIELAQPQPDRPTLFGIRRDALDRAEQLGLLLDRARANDEPSREIDGRRHRGRVIGQRREVGGEKFGRERAVGLAHGRRRHPPPSLAGSTSRRRRDRLAHGVECGMPEREGDGPFEECRVEAVAELQEAHQGVALECDIRRSAAARRS